MCKNCQRPPLIPGDGRRRSSFSGPNLIDALDGTWVIDSHFEDIAQPFIKRLTIFMGKCIDALGESRTLTEKDGHVYLLRGRVWVSEGALYREGRSGIVLQFHQEDIFGDDAYEPYEDEEEEVAEPDFLHILHNMAGGRPMPVITLS